MHRAFQARREPRTPTSISSAHYQGRVNQFSVLSSQIPISIFRAGSIACGGGGGADPTGVPFRLLSHHVHFLFQRRETLHHLMNAQRHIANGFNLSANRGRQAARVLQKQIGISQQRGEGIVQAMPHLQHVAAQHRLPLQRGAALFGRARASAAARCTASPAARIKTSSQFSSRRSTEVRGQRSRTSFAVAASWQTKNKGCKVECRGSRITDNNSRRNGPTMATAKSSTLRGHRSPLSMVNAGTLRSACQRAVMLRENSTSSEITSTVGWSTCKLPLFGLVAQFGAPHLAGVPNLSHSSEYSELLLLARLGVLIRIPLRRLRGDLKFRSIRVGHG